LRRPRWRAGRWLRWRCGPWGFPVVACGREERIRRAGSVAGGIRGRGRLGGALEHVGLRFGEQAERTAAADVQRRLGGGFLGGPALGRGLDGLDRVTAGDLAAVADALQIQRDGDLAFLAGGDDAQRGIAQRGAEPLYKDACVEVVEQGGYVGGFAHGVASVGAAWPRKGRGQISARLGRGETAFAPGETRAER